MKDVIEKIKYDALFIISLILFTASLIFYNIEKGNLPMSDEVFLLRFIKSPYLSLDPSGTFVITYVITKLFFFINSYPSYRYITGIMNLISVILFYFTGKIIIKNRIYSFLASYVLIISSYFIFISKHFSLEWSHIMLPILIIYFYFKWSETHGKKFLYLLSISSALGIIDQGASIYIIIPTFTFLLFLTIKNKIDKKIFLSSLTLFILFSSPYWLGIACSLINNEIKQFILERFAFWNIGARYSFLPVNIIFFNQFFNAISDGIFGNFVVASIDFMKNVALYFTIFLISAIFIVQKFYKNEKMLFLMVLFLGTILTILIFPIPFYYPGNSIIFFVPLIFLIFSEIQNLKGVCKVFPISALFLIVLYNFNNSLYLIQKNSYEKLENMEKFVNENNIENIFIQREIYERLSLTPYFRNVQLDIFNQYSDIVDTLLRGVENKSIFIYEQHYNMADNLIKDNIKFELLDTIDGFTFIIIYPKNK